MKETSLALGPKTRHGTPRWLSSVRGRIIAGFGLLVIILAAVAAGSAWQVHKHQSDTAAMEEHADTAFVLQDAQVNAEAAAASLQRYVTVGDETRVTGDEILLPEIRSQMAAAKGSLAQALADAERRGDREQAAALRQISAEADSVIAGAEMIIDLRQSGDAQTAVAALEATVLPFREFEGKLKAAAETELQEVSALRSQADTAGELALWVLIISGSTAAVLGLAASVFIARSIIKPLSSLEATAAAVSDGDLSARAQATGPRELLHLGSTLNHMMEAIEARTEDLRLANEELRERNRQLTDARTQAATDPLTGLGNHRTFHKRIRDEITSADTSGASVGLIMFDIDGFKTINDSLGHLAGDEILRQLAVTVGGLLKVEDVYRYGGDEFVVVLPGAGLKKTTEIAERLRLTVASMTISDGDMLTVSLGVCSFPEIAASAEELIYRADMAMYWAKSAGKNRVGDWDALLSRRTSATVPQYLSNRGTQLPDVVASLIGALAAKDSVTRAHTERCSWYTARLAQELGLGEEEISAARLAALLHDVGKLALPDELLCKSGPFSDDEWAQMRQHPIIAWHMLSRIDSAADAIPTILHHHEHFDGSGYPDGLTGEDIPIASRILLVADAFDAMTTDRPYRKAMPVEAAIEELKRNSGSQFDSTTVEAFLKILSRDGLCPLNPAVVVEEGSVRLPS